MFEVLLLLAPDFNSKCSKKKKLSDILPLIGNKHQVSLHYCLCLSKLLFCSEKT